MEFLNVFASVDKDHDLVIHEADLDLYAAEMKYEKAFTQKWLRLFDLDKDGRITFTEFCETLGLDEKIYEEKLREVRKTIAVRQQQQKQADADRESRRLSRLPKQQPPKPELKENVEPQQARKSQIPVKVQDQSMEEEVVKPQTSQKMHSGFGSQNGNKSSPEEVVIEFDEDDPRSIQVEFSDMEPKDLEEVKFLLAKTGSQSRHKSESPTEFDRRMMHELDGKMGKTWRCQTNPELSHKEVNYKEGNMAVLVDKNKKRVMLWRPQEAGGMCCCC